MLGAGDALGEGVVAVTSLEGQTKRIAIELV